MIICGILCGSIRNGRNVLGRLPLKLLRVGQSRIRHVANVVLVELIGANNPKLSGPIQRLTANEMHFATHATTRKFGIQGNLKRKKC